MKVFWENHDPTQGMRQGNDTGTQYRSGIYVFDDEQRAAAERSRQAYQPELSKRNLGRITTEIIPAPEFYYAEDYHQQYLSKNPNGYCGIGGTGVSCPVGLEVASDDVCPAEAGHYIRPPQDPPVKISIILRRLTSSVF